MFNSNHISKENKKEYRRVKAQYQGIATDGMHFYLKRIGVFLKKADCPRHNGIGPIQAGIEDPESNFFFPFRFSRWDPSENYLGQKLSSTNFKYPSTSRLPVKSKSKYTSQFQGLANSLTLNVSEICSLVAVRLYIRLEWKKELMLIFKNLKTNPGA